jgi:hypothetical protein
MLFMSIGSSCPGANRSCDRTLKRPETRPTSASTRSPGEEDEASTQADEPERDREQRNADRPGDGQIS